MKNIKNKKAILISCLALGIVAVGAVFAFSRDSSTLNNSFAIADYKIAYSEDFVAPSNWQPCEEVTKTFVIRNEGDAAINVRIRYEDYWRNKVDTEYLQPIKDGVTLAQIIFQNESDWTLMSDGYYHYKTAVEPGAATSSLFKSVKLNCAANFDKDNICTKTANGTVCEKPADEYEGATYHLRLVAETKQVSADSFVEVIANQANPRDYYIDFTKKAVSSDDVFVANGNGVNRYQENGRDIYYYRGEINNNNVLWANFCWKIIRTTATGGVKMIFNGAPSNVGGAMQCNATGLATSIGNTKHRFGNGSNHPSSVGYMHGDDVDYAVLSAGNGGFVFSNTVSRNGNTYTLDTSDGQSISGTWAALRETASTRYHYFCTNGASTCDNTRIGYIHNFGVANTIYYFPLNGYDDIEALKTAMFANDADSIAKTRVESWFAAQGLSDKEDELEDVVFCNDRTIFTGALAGKDADGHAGWNDALWDMRESDFFGPASSAALKNAGGNVTPSLGCENTKDSFTKEASNGNGALQYKVGLISADEAVLAGMPSFWFVGEPAPNEINASENYLYNGLTNWTISPRVFGKSYAGMFVFGTQLASNGTYEELGLRPVVSLKAGLDFVAGTGEKTNPYIVE